MKGTVSAIRAQQFWTPTKSSIASSNLTRFAKEVNAKHGAKIKIGDYDALHAWSIAYPAQFWAAVAEFTGFVPEGTSILSETVIHHGRDAGLPRLVDVSWMPGLHVNFASIVLRYASLAPDKLAILYRPESKIDDVGHRRRLTFIELKARVESLATALRNSGVCKGDAVAGMLANTPDAVICMLATVAVGAVWSSCSPDFGETAVCSRLEQIGPRVLFYSPAYQYKGKVNCVVENITRVAARLGGLEVLVCVPTGCCSQGYSVVSLAKKPPANLKHEFLRDFENRTTSPEQFEYEVVTMDDPVVTMFSSGTTGKPKCIVQGCGILLNQMKEHSLHHEVTERSTMLYSTSTGWMLFNWLVAALATGCTIVLYDGAAIPQNDPYRLINIASEENVTHFGSGAKYYKALNQIQGAHPRLLKPNTHEGAPVASLKMVMGTGSPSTAEHFIFVESFFGPDVQYVSMSGGTEINGCFALGTPWKPVIASELQCAGLGMDVCVFNNSGEPIIGESGELVCRNPCPCMPLCFWHDSDHRKYRMSYFQKFGPDIWSHGDFAVLSRSGGFTISGRSDSTLNPGGVRIGTADLYQVVESLAYIESALVAEQSVAEDSRVILLVVMRDQYTMDRSREKEIRDIIRSRLSPRHVPHVIIQIPEVPYTFSGKKCEIPVKKMLQGLEPNNREAVKNPRSFDSIQFAFQERGLLRPCLANVETVPTCKM